MKKKRLVIVGSILLTLMLALSGVIVLTTGAEEGEPSVTIAAQNVAFKDSVYLIYAVKADNVPAGAETGMLFWLSPQETYTMDNAKIKLTDSKAEEIDMGTGDALYDVYELNQLAARQMVDDVYAVAYIKDGDTVYYSAPMKYSILQYVYNIQKKGTADEKLLNLLNAMLDYGAAAQLYTGYKTDFLANAVTSQITVVDGTLDDGFTKGLYPSGTEITLTAPAEKDGKAFSYWKTGAGATVGTTATLTVTVGDADETYTAIYLLHTLSEVPAQAATCTTAGNSAYWSCTCGKFYSDANAENEIAENSWVISALGHDLTKTDAKSATCEEDGNNAYWTCSRCHKVYSDAEGAIETTVAAQTLAATGHNYGAATYEWTAVNGGYTCTGKRVCANNATHVDEATAAVTSAVTKAATYTEKGETTYTATFTKEGFATQTKTEEIAVLGHNWATEWSTNDGIHYYKADGTPVTGWQSDIPGWEGSWFYFYEDGAMATGWKNDIPGLEGFWVYFDPITGAMATGWKNDIPGLEGFKFYFDPITGAMATVGQQIGGNWYYFDLMMKTGWQQIGGNWYYFATTGTMATGWQQIGENWYYFDLTTGAMLVNTTTPDGYTVDENGRIIF